MKQPSYKLAQQIASPFTILEHVGNSYRLDLPSLIKVHLVFSLDKLCKALEDLLPGQRNPLLEPIKVDRELEQEVERILGARLVRQQLRYQVQQKSLDDDLDKYPAADLQNAPYILQDFHLAYLNRLGLLRNLKYQLKCTEEDIFPKDYIGDNSLA